jgi:nucleotidyltransferase/DNA polymerase involved in DNA repair
LWSTTPIKKVRNLGGKFGDVLVEKFGVELMSDLAKFSEKDLAKHCGTKAA